MAARSARDFGETLGVNVRLTWIDTAYGDYNTLHARLRELGARHVHDGICADCPYQMDMLRRLARDGIKAELGVASLRGGSAQMQKSLAGVKALGPGVVEAVTAPNEPDLEPVTDWVGKTRAHQAELYSRVKGDPALAYLPVVGPSLVHRASRFTLGDLSANLDRGNLHPYPGGSLPLGNIDDEKYIASQVSANKTLRITEVGYHADTSTNDPHRGVTEHVNSMYTPRILLEAFRGGVERTFFYQFIDPWSDARAAQIGISKSENSFGLLRNDLSPRPSFIALRNLLRAVDGDPAPVSSPGGLKLGLEGAGSDVRQLLLRSADGSYSLVLWRQVSLWNRDAKQPVTPAADPLEVVMGQELCSPSASIPVPPRWSGNAGRSRGGSPLTSPARRSCSSPRFRPLRPRAGGRPPGGQSAGTNPVARTAAVPQPPRAVRGWWSAPGRERRSVARSRRSAGAHAPAAPGARTTGLPFRAPQAACRQPPAPGASRRSRRSCCSPRTCAPPWTRPARAGSTPRRRRAPQPGELEEAERAALLVARGPRVPVGALDARAGGALAGEGRVGLRQHGGHLSVVRDEAFWYFGTLIGPWPPER